MTYPSLGRCSLMGACVGVLIPALLVSFEQVGITVPIGFYALCPATALLVGVEPQAPLAHLVTAWGIILFSNAMFFVLVGHVVFYFWRWTWRRASDA